MIRGIQVGKVVLVDRKICPGSRINEERGVVHVLARPVQGHLDDSDRQIVVKSLDLGRGVDCDRGPGGKSRYGAAPPYIAWLSQLTITTIDYRKTTQYRFFS